MLAERFDQSASSIRYPAYAQPKLDGYRGIYADGAFTSRTGLPIAEATRIRAELAGTGLVLDGELFRPGLSFQEVTKLIKRNDPSLEYHVYDVIMPAPYEERKAALEAFFAERGPALEHVKLVRTLVAHNAADVQRYHAEFTAQGYEGVMIRNGFAPYAQGKRSRDLQKLKAFKDAEFRVVGYEPSATGGVLWVCEVPGGKTFRVKPMGSDAAAREALASGAAQVGQFYTVRFQELTDAGVPRFPVGVGFRLSANLNLASAAPLLKQVAAAAAAAPRPSAAAPLKQAGLNAFLKKSAPLPPRKSAAGTKRARGCAKQVDAKYASRPSPPYPANECCGEVFRGNDGRVYVSSKVGAQSSCTWKPAPPQLHAQLQEGGVWGARRRERGVSRRRR